MNQTAQKRFLPWLVSAILTLSLSVALFVVPAKAQATEAQLYYVTDTYGLLMESEAAELESKAEQISQKYDAGVYVVIVDDYTGYYDGDISDAAMSIYEDYTLGVGEGDEGMILLLSMDDRDYSLMVFGDDMHYAFNEYGLYALEDFFLDDFADDSWYQGIADYFEWSELYLEAANDGTPFSEDNPPMDDTDKLIAIAIRVAIMILLPLLIAGVVIFFLNAKMKSVAKATQASEYVAGALNLTSRSDNFSHTTRTEVKISDDSDSNFKSSGGFSGTSGKF